EDPKALQVSIPRHPALEAVLAGDITIPCLITYLGPQPTAGTGGRRAVLGTPRVKWTFISEGREVEILVARGDRVKVSEDYRLRASLPIFHQRYTNASLLLTELRPNDSGIYRCDVQHGIEDGHDILHVKVKELLFWPTDSRMQQQLQQSSLTVRSACPFNPGEKGAGRNTGTTNQVQERRYPIQTPREACYGDMNGFPGVRNYGVVDPEDMYDVYCYAEDLPGEIFLETAPDRFTLEEAAQRCRALGAELASPGQLYAAWNAGLDACSPGWLADGSVRYPIVTPRERCGGALPGVKTIFLFRNQTGFPDAQSRYDAYCFREGTNSFSEAAGKYQGQEPEENLLQEIVTVAEKLEELQLPRAHEELESRGAIYAVPFFEDPDLGKPSQSPEDTLGPGARHPPLATSVSSGHPTPASPSPTALASPEAGVPLKLGSPSPAEEDGGQMGTAGGCRSPALCLAPSPAAHCLSALPFAEEEQGAAPRGGPGSASAESPGGGRHPGQPTEPEGPTGAPADSREASGSPRRGHKSGGASTPFSAAEDAELSGDVVESPGASPLPPAPSQPQEEGEEQSGAVWIPSPAAPGERSTVPAVTPWPGSSSAPALEGEEAAPPPPGTDRGMPASEEEEEEPAPSVATVEGFLAAVPGEAGGCVPNPCLNGGTCVEDGAQLTCLCLPGYGGSSCERPLRRCSPGWDSFQGACYRHFSTRRSWEDAESQCRHYGGHLATILTPEEQDFIN
ncbi:PGCB protein, partial [Hypocryptadius cinnamomeus]|nr:PGCB protein [Hypocryptadius cinnamomeus]